MLETKLGNSSNAGIPSSQAGDTKLSGRSVLSKANLTKLFWIAAFIVALAFIEYFFSASESLPSASKYPFADPNMAP